MMWWSWVVIGCVAYLFVLVSALATFQAASHGDRALSRRRQRLSDSAVIRGGVQRSSTSHSGREIRWRVT